MTDILLYLAIFASIAAILYFVAGRKEKRDDLQAASSEIKNSSTHINEITEAEAATRALIGDKAYERMVKRVDRVIARHTADRSVNVSLSKGPDSQRGWQELNSLLPGDPVWLRKSFDSTEACVEVYSGGYRIGRLYGEDAQRALPVLNAHELTGAYVSEQNSYGQSDVASMSLILFYNVQESAVQFNRESAFNESFHIDIPGTQRRVLLCQN